MGKFEETSSKGEKDIAECVNEACYLTTQIITLKATNLLSHCRLQSHDFSTIIDQIVPYAREFLPIKIFFSGTFKTLPSSYRKM